MWITKKKEKKNILVRTVVDRTMVNLCIYCAYRMPDDDDTTMAIMLTA